MKFSLIIVLFLIILESCDNSFRIEDQDIDKKDFNSVVYQQNPLDSIGIEHNIILTEFIRISDSCALLGDFDSLTYPSPNFRDKMVLLMNQTYHNLYPETTSSIPLLNNVWSEMNFDNYYSEDGNIDYMFDFAKLYINSNASSKDSLYCTNFLNDVRDLIDGYDGEDILADLQGLISNYETLILNQSWDSNETLSLGMIAIAKHSCQFWMNYYAQHQSIISKKDSKNNIQETKKTDKNEKAIIVTSDMIGGIVGSISGAAAAGAGSGGLAVLGGYFGGKIIGAASGSITAMGVIELVKFWKNLF